jgi:hypothetical protein
MKNGGEQQLAEKLNIAPVSRPVRLHLRHPFAEKILVGQHFRRE